MIEVIARMGYDGEKLMGELLKKKHSKLTTMYYLFCQKKEEEVLEMMKGLPISTSRSTNFRKLRTEVKSPDL